MTSSPRTETAATSALTLLSPIAGSSPGTDYCEQRQDIRRRARNHVRGLERPGCMVTIEPLSPDPETGELPITQAS